MHFITCKRCFRYYVYFLCNPFPKLDTRKRSTTCVEKLYKVKNKEARAFMNKLYSVDKYTDT